MTVRWKVSLSNVSMVLNDKGHTLFIEGHLISVIVNFHFIRSVQLDSI